MEKLFTCRKIKDIWDNIIWFTKDKPMDIYKTIRHWWRCNGKNPYHWKLVWYSTFHHYGWDSEYLWNIVQLCIKKSKYYFETHHYTSDEKRADIIRWQTIAIGLLDIMLEKRELWDWDYDNNDYKCLVYVNMKNKERFAIQYTNYETGKIVSTTKCFENSPHELYKEKASKLLMRILETYSENWWD